LLSTKKAAEDAPRRGRTRSREHPESRLAVLPSPLPQTEERDRAERDPASHGQEVQALRAPPRLVPLPEQPEESRYDYASYGELTGPLTDPPAGAARVALRRLPDSKPRRQLLRAVSVLMIQTAFLTWLMLPGHFPILSDSIPIAIASIAMLVSIYMIELFRLINVASLCIASALARDPIPMVPERGTKVAFLTTIVPSREPIEVVRRTLEAARRIRHDGLLDVWLLDEGDDSDVRQMCWELGVRHFSRRGVERWNQSAGGFKTESKHGNYNAWVDGHGDGYDFFVSVDPDHVPLPSYCERLLGYFRDPDVAFAVGPQVYGNYDNFVTKCAESQQFVFHGLIQRLGNFFRCPMLVGTNNAVRISALREIGGLRDSITEDLATSLSCHAARNQRTGNRWRSVYTPDLLAVGEGPANFTDFFNQQHRWSRGTFEGIRGHVWRSLRSLPWGPRLHYSLITSYYPSAALGWILGSLNCVLYLLLGSRGIRVHPQVWLAVYTDLALVQFFLYASNRKHNVSPHESAGSSGVAGMFISVLSAPIYVVALIGSLFRTSDRFVVTPKGEYRSPDGLRTFRWHLGWGTLLAAALAVSLWMNHPQSSMRLWSLTLICVCLIPPAVAIGRSVRNARSRRRSR
jgi:cellulose synthase/poly-beta-1,6-N-acetylglucosamine synthase-like glycosyltransferase